MEEQLNTPELTEEEIIENDSEFLDTVTEQFECLLSLLEKKGILSPGEFDEAYANSEEEEE